MAHENAKQVARRDKLVDQLKANMHSSMVVQWYSTELFPSGDLYIDVCANFERAPMQATELRVRGLIGPRGGFKKLKRVG